MSDKTEQREQIATLCRQHGLYGVLAEWMADHEEAAYNRGRKDATDEVRAKLEQMK